MPKGKKDRKGKLGFPKVRHDFGTSDEDSVNDNASVISVTSDGTMADEGEEVDEQSQADVLEEKLVEAIEGMTQRSAQGRTSCLESVGLALSKRYMPDFVMERKLTLTDGIERSLRKGRGVEQGAAAQLATLLVIQLGPGDLADDVCRALAPLLTLVLNDQSMTSTARSKCCWALGCLSFVGGLEDVGAAMTTLQEVFLGSCHKGDGSVPVLTAEAAALHAAALSAWSLLLTVAPPHELRPLHLPLLAQLLDSAHLDVRMAAGEAIALLLEAGRATAASTAPWDVDDLTLDLLRQLSTDSHKYRAKKDRKTQRSSFRDILRYVEENEPPNIQVRFGQETLAINSWSKKKQYDCFCQLLGSGMNLHLTHNDLLRDVLELGDKISPLNMVNNKQSKLARHLMNAANFKARSISRAKHRDKRAVVIMP